MNQAEKDNAAYWTDKLQNSWQDVNDFAKAVPEHTKGKGYKTLLDLGCGNGNDSLYFADAGFEVTCVDIVDASDKIQTQNSNIKCLVADIRDFDLPNAQFDVIFAHFSLHYFDDAQTRALFKKMYKMLAPGGMFFVKCLSTKSSLYGKGEKLAENIYHFDHVRHFFSEAYMRSILQDAGFEIENIVDVENTIGQYTSLFLEAIARKD